MTLLISHKLFDIRKKKDITASNGETSTMRQKPYGNMVLQAQASHLQAVTVFSIIQHPAKPGPQGYSTLG